MKYIKVIWKHPSADQPTVLYSEINDDGWETRKVDVFADGRRQYADENSNVGDTFLSDQPMPSLNEINTQTEFEGTEISGDEFEKFWQQTLDSLK